MSPQAEKREAARHAVNNLVAERTKHERLIASNQRKLADALETEPREKEIATAMEKADSEFEEAQAKVGRDHEEAQAKAREDHEEGRAKARKEHEQRKAILERAITGNHKRKQAEAEHQIKKLHLETARLVKKEGKSRRAYHKADIECTEIMIKEQSEFEAQGGTKRRRRPDCMGKLILDTTLE